MNNSYEELSFQEFRKGTYLFLPIFILLLSYNSCKSQAVNQNKVQQTFQIIDNYLSSLEAQNFNGAVFVASGNSVFKKGYGYANKEAGIINTPTTIFDIGSVTKQFTGAAILKLQMQGKLSVHDPVSKYIKQVPEDKKQITIHQLLIHSSGLPHALGNDYDLLSKESFIDKALASELKFTPGSRYEYSNVGYSLLAAIIERVSGNTYEEYLNQNLFQPAGMKQTGYVIPVWQEFLVATGYSGDKVWGKPNENPWDKTGPYWNLLGNGGILSTAEDLYTWHLALLGNDILNQDAKETYYTKHISEGGNSYYGYGWALFPTPRNTTLISHNGGNGIFFCSFLRYLEEDITIILLCNSFKKDFHSIDFQIAKTMFNPDYRPGMEAPARTEPGKEGPHQELVKSFVKAVKSGEKAKIENLVNTLFTDRLKDMVPMEQHIQMLLGLKSEMGTGEIKGIRINGNEVKIHFQNSPGPLTLMEQDGKIAGVMVGD
ncbi:MAG TPA: serine hydrolase domain-containing protein [Saprospiraceae bacterium]|nr:serine hydrolase domain-containing protein [Saprospiraceae bacterium]